MPNYFNNAIAHLHHTPPINPQHPPHPYNAPIYGQKRQFFIPTINNEKLTTVQLKHYQELCGFLIIILKPLKKPCKQPSAPSPTTFQPAHVRISDF